MIERDYLKTESRFLGRSMEVLWFGRAGRPVLLFPTSMGRFYQNEDFGLIGGLGGKIASGEIQVICADSVDEESWYNRGVHPGVRCRRHDQYDAYLHQELLPFIRTRSGRTDLAVFGASFGGYHAMNLACRYPNEVKKAISFSGLYDVHQFLDVYWDDTCYFHCPTAFVANMDQGLSHRLAAVSFVVATGEHDSLVNQNREFATLLARKGVPIHCEIWPGVFGHDWPWWIHHLPRFLP
jgi:esterase/lipase superfamily enzyme